ncbi:MAG: LamG domain-containing protein [Candidatus Pacebacteria bacterium]|nr:LamG domain-containing protein [Candidatus Paceibacterota bacterium]
MNKGFTLIEILVVIVVIGVLSAFILVGMNSISSSANIAKGQAFSNSLRNSLLLNLVSEYKLDGSFNDSWGTNNGTNNGATLATSGCVKGSCYYFDGGDYIYLGNATTFDNDIGSAFTISTWSKHSEASTLQEIFGKGYLYTVSKGIDLRRNGNDYFYVFIGNGTTIDAVISNSTVSTNTWYHVVAIYNGITARMYVNGVLQTDTATVAAPLQWYDSGTSKTPSLGFNTAGVLTGYIDEVQIYNQPLSTSQIQENYYSGINRLLSSNSIEIGEFVDKISQLRNSISVNP